MTSTRISTYTDAISIKLYVMDCPACATVFGITADLEKRRRADGQTLYCPNGHNMSWTLGKSAEEKLRDAETRNTALTDQLTAAVQDAESTRVALLRDRQRFANGVCPCCNRSFDNVRRHMTTQHPDYDTTKVKQAGTIKFRCTCSKTFDTLRGLRVHQGHMRGDNWDAPTTSKTAYWGGAHLTKV